MKSLRADMRLNGRREDHKNRRTIRIMMKNIEEERKIRMIFTRSTHSVI